MKRYYVTLFAFIFSLNSWAITLKEASDLKNPGAYSYKALFTNPDCKTYDYEIEIFPIGGFRSPLEHKPKGAWCERGDSNRSGFRPNSPQQELLDWIYSEDTKEVFFTYLSLSNTVVTKALIKNIEERGLKVTFIIDHPAYSGTRLAHEVPDDIMEKSRKVITKETLSDREFFKYIFKTKENGRWISNRKAAKALAILNAEAPTRESQPKLYLRGHHRSTLGYAHNKLFIVNPQSDQKIGLVFSSGNMSSGVVLHHENWHFVTLSPKTYFAQSHLCLMNNMIQKGNTKREFVSAMRRCRWDISYEQEEDIKTYFVPGEGAAAYEAIKQQIEENTYVDMAAHRFLHRELIELLTEKVKSKNIKMKLVVDDDIYWSKHDSDDLPPKRYPNNRTEYYKVNGLVKAGTPRRRSHRDQRVAPQSYFDVQYVQTNHWSRYLHHNKFMIFSNFFGQPKAVFTGAGNFTKAAFTKNFENFYLIQIPEVLEAFEEQYKYLWKISSPAEKMPEANVKPDGSSPEID